MAVKAAVVQMGFPLPAVLFDASKGQNVVTGAASAASAALASDTELVMLSAKGAMWVTVGAATPTAVAATAGSYYMADGAERAWLVPRGQGYMVAAIQDSAVGNLSIMEIAG